MASNLHEFSPGSRHHDAAHTSVSKRSRFPFLPSSRTRGRSGRWTGDPLWRSPCSLCVPERRRTFFSTRRRRRDARSF